MYQAGPRKSTRSEGTPGVSIIILKLPLGETHAPERTMTPASLLAKLKSGHSADFESLRRAWKFPLFTRIRADYDDSGSWRKRTANITLDQPSYT
jgi:hypothetical protein